VTATTAQPWSSRIRPNAFRSGGGPQGERPEAVQEGAHHLGVDPSGPRRDYFLTTVWKPKTRWSTRARDPHADAPAPSSAFQRASAPVIPNQPIVKPTIGTPVPVRTPGARADHHDQQEIAAINAPVGVGGSGKDSLVIASDDMPSEGVRLLRG